MQKNKEKFSPQLLVICGPTGTGKTDLGLYLAKKFDGEIVSADSRQVYKSLDIGTGKDIPSGSKFTYVNPGMGGYYEMDGIKVWGYDLVDPDDSFSVGQYITYALTIIKDIHKRKKLPILIGGTGLYIKGVVDGIETASIPPNLELRKLLQEKSAAELFDMLAQFDSMRAANLNQSDKNNPRRLIRSIEVAQTKKKIVPKKQDTIFNCLFVGLMAPKEEIQFRIEKRVKKRIDLGIKKEIEGLLKKGLKWQDQSMVSLGYAEWQDYFEKGKSELEIESEWIHNEQKYTKRQMIWFKKDARINWLDITDSKYTQNVEKLVKKWYKKGYAKES